MLLKRNRRVPVIRKATILTGAIVNKIGFAKNRSVKPRTIQYCWFMSAFVNSSLKVLSNNVLL